MKPEQQTAENLRLAGARDANLPMEEVGTMPVRGPTVGAKMAIPARGLARATRQDGPGRSRESYICLHL